MSTWTTSLFSSPLWSLIEIIGVAASKVSADLIGSTAGIAWRKIVGMRHQLVHNYREINVFHVWETAQEDIPILIDQLRPLLPSTDAEGIPQ